MTPAERDADDLSAFCCQNPDCPDYGRRGLGNLTVPMRYGPRQRRLLRCKTCKARFSERKGTALFGTQLPEDKVVAVLNHIAEGVGVRKTGRLVGVNKTTVVRYFVRAADHDERGRSADGTDGPRDARRLLDGRRRGRDADRADGAGPEDRLEIFVEGFARRARVHEAEWNAALGEVLDQPGAGRQQRARQAVETRLGGVRRVDEEDNGPGGGLGHDHGGRSVGGNCHCRR